MSVIDVKDLAKTFKISGGDPIEVLKGLSLQVQPGEFIAIMGPSGSGKSTLLNILASIETVTSGMVSIAEQELAKAEEKELVEMRRKTTSIIYQDFNLLAYMTALENVMFPMMLSGVPEAEARERALDLLKKVQLGHRADHSPDDLSGGEQQRVGVARALANNPKVLLADEPTGNLDTKTGNTVIKLFRELVAEGLTVIMVTHDIGLSRKADRILVLREGKLFKEEEVMEGL
ncbi:MAG: ABC transporter ATP-binding protein [Candidatus Hodarchaeales archaeon]|jgi:putative ABC transport system ATP-binding protein